MSTVSNVVLPKEKKVRVKKADVPAPAVESPKKVATPKKESTPKPQEESEAEAEKKPRKPTLSAKYTKFVVFGYSMVNALVAASLVSEDQVDAAYAQIKLMDSVEDQTAFYSNFLENLSASGKAMKKFVNDKKKPPKEPKVRKPRAKKADSDAEPKEKKPRAKKEAKAESESEPKEPKEKKPRAKKSVTVESDANVDLISNLVNAAQADPIPAPVEAPAEAPKAKKESKAKEPKAKKESKTKKEAPVVEPTPALEAEDDDDDEVIQTRETVIDGETFLVDQEGNLYDPETHEFVRKL
jgi:hypothetical protein